MATVTLPKLLTAEEFFLLPEPECPTELVQGRIVEHRFSGFRHGVICCRTMCELSRHVESRDLGVVVCNTGVITERAPDTVRGTDIAFYSYQRVPKDQTPIGYPVRPPELVIEVVSADDDRLIMDTRTAEFLVAGVNAVAVVDPETCSATVCHPDERVQVIEGDECLEFPELLPGFSVSIAELLND